jgi:demethylmenaquinone methyltransferase/2-methoxy-6-polyprenyl-1,4-benzoquinol methylase
MAEQVTPYGTSGGSKKQQVARMFDNIALRYDFLNRFLSFGIDRYWRSSAIRELRQDKPKLILDIATGTADVALTAMKLHPEKIFGVDISEEMLEIGRKKVRAKGLAEKIELLAGDSEKLIFDDNKFDAVTVAFGVRNFERLQEGLREIHRVLKPGGKLVVLEFSKPHNRLIRALYDFYSTRITPSLGKMISKDPSAYTYLHESIRAFPSGRAFLDELNKAGFVNTTARPMTFGVVSVYCGIKA